MHTEIPDLIVEAAKVLGTEYQLAKALKITPQELSGMKYGRRACPPDLAAVMASITDRDAVAVLVESVMERLSPDRQQSLAKALGLEDDWRKRSIPNRPRKRKQSPNKQGFKAMTMRARLDQHRDTTRRHRR